MRIAVIGSRTFTNYPQMVKCLDSKPISKIITGDANGADFLAKKYARDRGIEIETFPNDKKAIVNNCDAVVAFWDGQSHGTQDVLRLAKNMNRPLEVFFLENKVFEAPFGYINL